MPDASVVLAARATRAWLGDWLWAILGTLYVGALILYVRCSPRQGPYDDGGFE